MKKINAVEGIVKTMETMSGITNIDRTDVFRDKIGKVIVDTVEAFDTKEWETGILQSGDWIIVQQYENQDEASIGHKKWLKKMKENPKRKLKSIQVWDR